MSSEVFNAVVLHRRPYRETSYLVDLFTRESGKVSAVCKGARSTKSDKKSLLQPFQPLSVILHGRRDLKNLGAMESTQSMYLLTGQAMFSALYLNEILNRSLPEEVACEEIFDLYLATLVRLSQQQPIEPVLREFEISLLDGLGYGIDWRHDWQTSEDIQPDAYYTFVALHGFQRAKQVSQSKNCFAGHLLLAIASKQWDQTSLNGAKRIMRMALLPILGDKPLKSRELFLQVEQFK